MDRIIDVVWRCILWNWSVSCCVFTNIRMGGGVLRVCVPDDIYHSGNAIMTNPWNGLPDQPERSGWHIIACGAPKASWWDAERQYWWDAERRFYITALEIKASSRSYKYFGAVYSSSELAQMRKDERERCAVLCDDYGYSPAHQVAEAIRALTDDEGKKS